MHVFWERGYEGASLRDLEQATGLGRASLYGAFGDKESLFLKVLERFSARTVLLSEALSGAPTVREGFDRLFVVWIDLHPTHGCMLSQAAGESICSPRLKALLASAQEDTTKLFLGALGEAISRGELPAEVDIEHRTRVLLVGLQGLSQATKLGQSREELLSVARFLVAAVFTPSL